MLAQVDTQIKIALVMVFVSMGYVLVTLCFKEKPVINLYVLIIALIPKEGVTWKSIDVNVYLSLKVSAKKIREFCKR